MGEVKVSKAIESKQCFKNRDSEAGEKIKSSLSLNFSKEIVVESFHILKAQTHLLEEKKHKLGDHIDLSSVMESIK